MSKQDNLVNLFSEDSDTDSTSSDESFSFFKAKRIKLEQRVSKECDSMNIHTASNEGNAMQVTEVVVAVNECFEPAKIEPIATKPAFPRTQQGDRLYHELIIPLRIASIPSNAKPVGLPIQSACVAVPKLKRRSNSLGSGVGIILNSSSTSSSSSSSGSLKKPPTVPVLHARPRAGSDVRVASALCWTPSLGSQSSSNIPSVRSNQPLSSSGLSLSSIYSSLTSSFLMLMLLLRHALAVLIGRAMAMKKESNRSSFILDGETVKQWKDRLWPTSALLSFVRAITLCRFSCTDEERLHAFKLQPWWILPKSRLAYDSYASYASSFFLSICEECRESLTVGCGDGSLDSQSKVGTVGNMRKAVIVDIQAKYDDNAPRQAQLHASDMSSIYIIRAALQHGEYDTSYWAGDLVALRSPTWSTVRLGVVQTWDPDNDVALGVAARAAGIPLNTMQPRGASLEESSSRYLVHIIVCLSGDPLASEQDIGGWLPYGSSCVPGEEISIVSLGNTMTSLRECQALVAITSMHKSFQQLIFNPCETVIVQGTATGTLLSALSCPASVSSALWARLTEQFNESQLRAIRSTCASPDSSPTPSDGTECEAKFPITLLQGPPGTGKTRVILGLVSFFLAGALEKKKPGTKISVGASLRQSPAESTNRVANQTASRRNVRILICAPSNTAIDEVVYRLKTHGYYDDEGDRRTDLKLVRIGGHSSSGRQVASMQTVHWSPTKPSIDDAHDGISRQVEMTTLDSMADERRRAAIASKQKPLSLMDYKKNILEHAEVVCSTLSGAGSQPLLELAMRIPNFRFDVIIIDEAAQAVEPSALIPFKFNPSVVVMIGDPQQLPATVFSQAAKAADYDISLFSRLHKAGFPLIMLETQYRMHSQIAKFPSKYFYNGLLKTSTMVSSSASHQKPYHGDASGKFRPFVFHDVTTTEQRTGDNKTRISNADEIKYVVELYQSLKSRYPGETTEIGIISPYREQIREMKKAFRLLRGVNANEIEISTLDGFQGREKDIVIFSCVRGANIGNDIGFLKEPRRLNVAITRSKYALWIVGNATSLSNADSTWKGLVDFARAEGCLYRSDSLSRYANKDSMRYSMNSNVSSNSNTHPSSSHRESIIKRNWGQTKETEFARNSNKRAVYVKGLSRETTRETVRTLFSRFGEIKHLTLIVDKVTGRSEGKADVIFRFEHEANEAVRATPLLIDGRSVKIQHSTKRQFE